MAPPLAAAGRASRLGPVPLLFLATACLVWGYWTTLAEMAQCWAHNAQYSHGYLVPLFALALLWLRRQQMPAWPLQPSWWGAPLLLFGICVRLFGAWYFSPWLDAISLVPTLGGLWLMIGGRAAWRWAWPAVLFLVFMIPLPYRLSGMLAGPLQRLATVVSTFGLQTLGIPALAEGNVILLSEVEIGVVEACSGLRMLVIFFALSTAVALLLRRPLWERLFVVFSAIPIALVSNIIRITVTGVLHELVSNEFANEVFHDWAGWLMMPLALAMLWVELRLLSLLLIEQPAAAPRVDSPTRRRPASATAPRRPRQSAPPLGRARSGLRIKPKIAPDPH
jgi:exosortase